MGQKVHPIGFRIGISKNHKSFWYSDLKSYSKLLKTDNFIRNYLDEKLKETTPISDIEINRKSGSLIINIYATNTNQLLKGGNSELIKLQSELSEKLSETLDKKDLVINIIEIVNPDGNARILANFIRQQLEKRTPFRRAMKNAITKAEKSNVKGIKVQVSGRLNGAEIARTEWIREGRVPLHTLKANIDYYNDKAQTLYGILGIKVWVYNQ